MARLTVLIPLILTLFVYACGGGSGSSTGSGTLSIGITDTPVADAEKVVIHFSNIQLHSDAGITTDIPVIDPVTKLPGRSIDLLQLQGDRSLVLFSQELPAGTYNWMRLDIDLDPGKSYIQIGGQQHALTCTSCQNNGYKLNRSFKVEDAAVMAYTVDFDLLKSINLSNTGYHLRPTLRMVETEAAGHLSGTVDATLIGNLGGEAGCVVYVYDGFDVVPQDIYLPEGIPVPDTYHNPIASAMVAAATHDYTVGYLAAGQYTVALTCDGEYDDTMMQDSGVTFYGAANVTIMSGQTATHPFTL